MRIIAVSQSDIDFEGLLKYVNLHRSDLLIYVGSSKSELVSVVYERDPLLYVKRRALSCLKEGRMVCDLDGKVTLLMKEPVFRTFQLL